MKYINRNKVFLVHKKKALKKWKLLKWIKKGLVKEYTIQHQRIINLNNWDIVNQVRDLNHYYIKITIITIYLIKQLIQEIKVSKIYKQI